MNKVEQVYQFKITLLNTKPPIWRRIQVPEKYSFWDLHVAIQDAMGWEDYHLHQFEFGDVRNDTEVIIGLPDEESPPNFRKNILAGWEQPIAQWFTPTQSKAKYWYDFGDDWWHSVVLEKILPAEPGFTYPRCAAGKRACPPEDCGGPWGYLDLLAILSNPKHKSFKELSDWLGEPFDPEYFQPEDVVFDNPRQRLRSAFSER